MKNENRYWASQNERNNHNGNNRDRQSNERDYNSADNNYPNSNDNYRSFYNSAERESQKYNDDRFNDSSYNENRGWENQGYRNNLRNENDRYGRFVNRENNYNNMQDRDWWDKTKDEVSSWFGDDEAERRRKMDDIRDYNHKGKGPKNYKRSPERIKEDINDKLSDNWMIDASEIEVEVNGTEVTLNGTVDRRVNKRMAEDIAESVSGVTHVQNNLRVNINTSIENKADNKSSLTSNPANLSYS
ncbi:MAG: BON domain-containing protein, partial [Ginsengibacter sp.]